MMNHKRLAGIGIATSSSVIAAPARATSSSVLTAPARATSSSVLTAPARATSSSVLTAAVRAAARVSLLLVLIIGAGGLTYAVAQRKDAVSYRDAIVVLPDETRDNVVSFGGDIDVQGKVRKSVLAFGGSITISGEVGEAVVGFGARITLKETAVVKGDLVILGGSIEKAAGSRVDGDTVNFKSSELFTRIFGEGFKGFFALSFWPIILIFKLVNFIVWLLLAVIVSSTLSKRVTFASDQVRKAFWPTFGVGLAAQFLFGFALAIGVILCLVLIGIPIVMSLGMGAIVVKIFGRVVLLFLIGESLSRAFHKQTITPAGAAVLGTFIVGFVSFIPFLGFLFTGVLGIIGWGAAIRTKFGTTENWFARGARPIPPGGSGLNF